MKRAEINWFIIMAVIALIALLAMLFVSSGVFSKFSNNTGGIMDELSVKSRCQATSTNTDNDNDGYIGGPDGTVCVDGRQYICDTDDSKPDVNFGTSDKKSTGQCKK